MTENGNKKASRETQSQPPQAPPPPKDEVVAPPFKWVTKGEKGRGVEPGIDVDNASK